MTQAQHTAGPWYLTEPDRVEAENFGMICTARGDFLDAPRNARLIAAAPELLAALEAVMKWWTETPAFQDGDDDMPAAVFDAARAAIAKARGQA